MLLSVEQTMVNSMGKERRIFLVTCVQQRIPVWLFGDEKAAARSLELYLFRVKDTNREEAAQLRLTDTTAADLCHVWWLENQKMR